MNQNPKMEDIIMKTVQATFLLLIVCLLGCTSTHRLRPAHEEDYVLLNNRAAQKHAMVTFVGGRKIRVDDLRMTADSTYWNYSNKIASAQIKEVRFISRGKGTLQGWGFGFLLGAVVGLATIEGAPDEDCSGPNYGPCIDKTGWVLLFGAGGAALGLPIGAMRGHRDVYVIEQEATGTN